MPVVALAVLTQGQIIGIVVAAVFMIVVIAVVLSQYREIRKLLKDTPGSDEAILAAQKESTDRLHDEQLRIAAEQRDELARTATDLRDEIAKATAGLREETAKTTAGLREENAKATAALREEIGRTLADQAMASEQKLESIRKTIEERVAAMQEGNERQLNRMRETVDEKLQETLNRRISESFRTVQEQLGKVSEGLGEMQTLAADVGGLKNVLSNVKTKGILGEYQLAAILEQMLSKEQYEENIATKEGSQDRVEFAIRLPGTEDGGPLYMPIDAKFPSTSYEELMGAYEAADPARIDIARKALAQSAKQSARTIHEKYVDPPHTTDFAIMFLPTEGLYAEIVNLGLIEELQRLYKIVIAGPSTMVAILNSFQMGFKTLAIQKRSSEVWDVLRAVKTEFGKFETVLKSARNRMRLADDDLEKLIGTRTNMINRRLKNVEALAEPADADGALLIEAEALPDTEPEADDG